MARTGIPLGVGWLLVSGFTIGGLLAIALLVAGLVWTVRLSAPSHVHEPQVNQKIDYQRFTMGPAKVYVANLPGFSKTCAFGIEHTQGTFCWDSAGETHLDVGQR